MQKKTAMHVLLTVNLKPSTFSRLKYWVNVDKRDRFSGFFKENEENSMYANKFQSMLIILLL